MKKRSNKFLALLLSITMLCGITSAAAAAPTKTQQPTVENYSSVDFTGTSGPDNLDEIYPRPNGRSAANTSSTSFTDIKNIVILVNFNGLDEFATPARINTLNSSYNTKANSLKGYISHTTYNTINVDSPFYPKAADGTTVVSYVDPQPIGYYEKYSAQNTIGYQNDTQRFARETELVTGAFNFVKTQVEADYTGAQLDNDNDGRIDSVSFITNCYTLFNSEEIGHGDLLWPHKYSSSGLFMNQKEIRDYNFLSANIPPAGTSAPDTGMMAENPDNAEHSTVVHEFLHTLGLPDLYHYSSDGIPVGYWDLMANHNSPQNILQYMQREYMGWGKPIHQVTESGAQTLQLPKYQNADTDGGYDGSPESALILRSPFNNTEFFVVEYRAKTGFDVNLPGEGLIIYRINTNVTSKSNAGGPPDYLYIFRPGESSVNPGDLNGTMNAYFSAQSGRTSIGKPYGQEAPGFDNQTLYFSDGTNSGIVINQIGSAGGDTITFNVTMPSEIQGSGTAGDPYRISWASQLNLMSQYPDKYFKLTRNIDCYGFGTNFTPAQNFTGELNGDNYTISNLYYTESGSIPTGLFSSIGSGGGVRDLKLSNCSFTGTNSVGVLAGTLAGTVQRVIITDGYARNGSTAYSQYAGGICGTSEATAMVSGCSTAGTVTGKVAGGLAGINNSATWSFCYSDNYIGGVDRDSIRGSLFGSQMVSAAYIPGNGLYWNLNSSTADPANITKLVETPYTGKEGMTGAGLNQYAQIQPGATVQLLQTNPSTASVSGTWESSNTSVATVSNGTVTGVAAGTTTITLTVPLYGQIMMRLTANVTVLAA